MITFEVHGEPIPQGSMRAFVPKGWSRPIITAANKKTKPWRQEVANAAYEAMKSSKSVPSGRETPIQLEIMFRFLKPKSAKKSVTEKVTKPDLDKLIRSVLDALTGVCFTDDSQVVEIRARKMFSTSPGAAITMWEEGDNDLPPRAPHILSPYLKDSEMEF